MNIQTLLANILVFLNGTIVPFLISVAFLVFVWNAVRYFVIGGNNEESREKARSLALWGIIGFVILISLWGIVNLLVNGLGFNNRAITPDYMQGKGGGGQNNNSWNPFNRSETSIDPSQVERSDWAPAYEEPPY